MEILKKKIIREIPLLNYISEIIIVEFNFISICNDEFSFLRLVRAKNFSKIAESFFWIFRYFIVGLKVLLVS